MTAAPTTRPKEGHMQNGLTPVDEIIVDKGLNPRTIIEADELKELVFSIKTFGVLQPLLVRKGDDGKLHLVEGHRRLRAAKAAKLASVPTYTLAPGEGTNDHEAAALVTNVVRSNLHPVDEGRALRRMRETHEGLDTNVALAKAAGLTPERVARNLRYAYVPTIVGDLMLTNRLPLSAVEGFQLIAEVDFDLAVEVAKAATEELKDTRTPRGFSLDASRIADNPGAVVEQLVEYRAANTDTPPAKLLLTAVQIRTSVDQLAKYGVEGASKLQTRLKEQINRNNQYDLKFGQDDVDAARAFGALVEFPKSSQYATPIRFVTDGAWYIDRVTLILDAMASKKQFEREQKASERHQALPEDERKAASPAHLKAIRKRKKEAEEARRKAVVASNHELGRHLALQLGKRKLTCDDAKILAARILDDRDNAWKSWEMMQEQRFPMPADYKPSSGNEHPAQTALVQWVLRPRSSDEVIGRLFQVLIAEAFVDHSHVAVGSMGRNNHDQRSALAKVANGCLPELTRRAFDHAETKPNAHEWFTTRQTATEIAEYQRSLEKPAAKAKTNGGTKRKRGPAKVSEPAPTEQPPIVEEIVAEPLAGLGAESELETVERLSSAIASDVELSVSAD